MNCTRAAVMLWIAALGCACRTQPKPLGEAVVVIRTDVGVPRFVSKLRIEVMSEDGTVRDTRDVLTPSALDWPVSFSVVDEVESEARVALVRIRAYPDGHERDPRPVPEGEAPWTEPPSWDSIQEVCEHAPLLELGTELTLRRGPTAVTTMEPFKAPGAKDAVCTNATISGSVAARVVVTEAATYQFEIVQASPNGERKQAGGDTTLAIRTDCASPDSQLACADDISGDNALSRLSVDLVPGTYWVVTGGREAASADLTMRFDQRDVFQTIGSDFGRSPLRPIVAPSGPPEPEPGVTIDRVVAIRLEPGVRGSVPITLSGECFGTVANVARRTTCVDRAGIVEPVEPVAVAIPISRARGDDIIGTWSGQQRVACASAAPPGIDAVCVAGGAFVRGDQRVLGDAGKSQPERVRVLRPFYMDRYEVTVARWRAALAAGFFSPDTTPDVQDEPIVEPRACTFTSVAGDRESYPLNCLTWAAARAFCHFVGGDLPTEEQSEFAATASGKTIESAYPWGDELPDCDRAAIGRRKSGRVLDDVCASSFGPVAVDAAPWALRDVTPDGVVGMAGNVQEWQRDGFLPYDHPAWRQAGLRNPLVFQQRAPMRATRGSDWAGRIGTAVGSTRRAQSSVEKFVNLGFRCVWESP